MQNVLQEDAWFRLNGLSQLMCLKFEHFVYLFRCQVHRESLWWSTEEEWWWLFVISQWCQTCRMVIKTKYVWIMCIFILFKEFYVVVPRLLLLKDDVWQIFLPVTSKYITCYLLMVFCFITLCQQVGGGLWWLAIHHLVLEGQQVSSMLIFFLVNVIKNISLVSVCGASVSYDACKLLSYRLYLH